MLFHRLQCPRSARSLRARTHTRRLISLLAPEIYFRVSSRARRCFAAWPAAARALHGIAARYVMRVPEGLSFTQARAFLTAHQTIYSRKAHYTGAPPMAMSPSAAARPPASTKPARLPSAFNCEHHHPSPPSTPPRAPRHVQCHHHMWFQSAAAVPGWNWGDDASLAPWLRGCI